MINESIPFQALSETEPLVHKSPRMKRPRSNRTENNKEDTAEECETELLCKHV